MATTLRTSMIVSLVDRVTAPAAKVAASLRGITRAGGYEAIGGRLNGMVERNRAQMAKLQNSIAGAYAGFYTLKGAIAAPIKAAMDFESAMADVRKVVNFTSDKDLADFKAQLLGISKVIPTSVNGLSQIAAAAGQAGIAKKDIIDFTREAATIGVAFDISAKDAGDAMAKMMTGLNLTIPQVVSLSDAMNNLSNNQASSAAEILDVVRRVGAQGKTFGFTAEQVAAFGSAMVSAGAETDVAATSFRNMGNALTKGSGATKRQREAYKALGLDAVKVAKSMQKDAVGTTLAVMDQLAKLPKYQRNTIAEDLFGNQARALPILLTNLPLLRESLGMVADKTQYAGSAQKEYNLRLNTFANKVQLFGNRMTALGIAVGNALIPPLSKLMDLITPLVEKLTQWTAAHPKLTAAILGTAGALLALKLVTIGLSFVGLLGKGGALEVASAGFKTLGKSIKGAGETIAMQKFLASGADYGGLAMLADGAKGAALAIPGIAGLSDGLATLGAAVAGVGLGTAGIIAAVAVAIGAIGVVVWKYWDRISSFCSGFANGLMKELKPALDAAAPAFKPVSDVVGVLGDGLGKLRDMLSGLGSLLSSVFTREIGTPEQKAAWSAAGENMAEAMVESIKGAIMGLVDWFKGLPQMILNAIGSIDLSSIISMPDLRQMVMEAVGHIFGGGAPAGPTTPIPNLGGANPMRPITGHRAAGGRVWPGGSFLVGEKGEERFLPDRPGRIEPHGAGGNRGPININVVVNGAGKMAAEIGREIAQAAADELGSLMRGIHGDEEARY
jgi:TP901 family phage tail tape measure protein